MLSERPSIIVYSELFKIDKEHLGNKASNYVQRKKEAAASSTTNPAEFHRILDNIR